MKWGQAKCNVGKNKLTAGNSLNIHSGLHAWQCFTRHDWIYVFSSYLVMHHSIHGETSGIPKLPLAS